MQKAMLVKHDGVVISKMCFTGDVDAGILLAQNRYTTQNPLVDLTFTVFDSDDNQEFIDAVVVPNTSIIY